MADPCEINRNSATFDSIELTHGCTYTARACMYARASVRDAIPFNTEVKSVSQMKSKSSTVNSAKWKMSVNNQIKVSV